MSASLAFVKQQFRIIRRDPWFLAIMFGMPMIAMPLLRRTMAISLQASGYANATGAEQVVPGQVVMFGFFVGGSAGFCVFREHGWKTWDRLRASSATPTGLLFGFATPFASARRTSTASCGLTRALRKRQHQYWPVFRSYVRSLSSRIRGDDGDPRAFGRR